MRPPGRGGYNGRPMAPPKKDKLRPVLLLVINDTAAAERLTRMLRRGFPGCIVRGADTPEAAAVAARGGDTDCAIIGADPPGLSGIELCRRLKADPDTDAFPILLVTDRDTDARTRVLGLEAGADDFLPREAEPMELLAKVRVMLRIKRAEAGLREVNRRLADVAEDRSRALYETDLRYRLLFDACDNAVLLFEVTGNNEGGRVLEINETACRWLGYSREEAARLILRNLSVPDRMQNLQGRIESIVLHRQLSFETVLTRRDGSRLPMFVTAGIVDTEEGSAVLAVGRTGGAAPAEQGYGFLADQTGQLIYDCNVRTGDITWGGAFTQVTGYTAAELAGFGWRRWRQRIHPDDRPLVLSRFREALRGVGKYQMEYRILHKSGETRHIEDAGVALPGEDGRALRMLGTMKDITARVQTQEERRRLENQFRHSQRLESLGVLAGGIAHDFNNILAGIIGLTDLALRDIAPDSRTHEDLHEALQAAHRAKDLVRQILAFSRRGGEERDALYLHIVAREALKLLRASLPPTIDIMDTVDTHSGAVMANAAQMHQVIMNLCTNAAQAMRESGGRLELRVEDVEVDAGTAAAHPRLHVGPYVLLTVNDTGHGMSDAVLERVFDPFFTTKRPGEGTGMGLAVAHGIVTGHGGAIRAESRIGAGSSFQVWLPRVGGVLVEEQAPPAVSRGGSERILFVDDDEAVLRFADLALPRLGFSVTLCRDAGEALRAFERGPGHFDLVITDQVMPGMSGSDLAVRITSRRPDLPVLLFTGYSDMIDKDDLKAAGISSVMIKPVTVNDLVGEIRRIMDGRPAGHDPLF